MCARLVPNLKFNPDTKDTEQQEPQLVDVCLVSESGLYLLMGYDKVNRMRIEQSHKFAAADRWIEIHQLISHTQSYVPRAPLDTPSWVKEGFILACKIRGSFDVTAAVS